MKLPVILSALFALSSSCDSVPSPPDEETQKVDETYNLMNKALAAKDLPQFMVAYREAVAVKEQLKESFEKQGSFSSGIFSLALMLDLTEHGLGNIATKTLSNPSILENWPTSCPSLDSEAKGLAQELYQFNQNRKKDLGDQVVGNIGGDGHFILYDDTSLALARNRNIHPKAQLEHEARYFLDGTYADMQFSTPASLMLYTLFATKHSSASPLESTVERSCSFIDLGLDGIDACDARLNGVLNDEAGIKSANERAKECMGSTLTILKQRYAGTSYFRK